MHNVPQKNREMLERNLRSDPVLRARLVGGRWVARPSGDALFKAHFSEARHVRGDPEKNLGLVPVVGYPIVLGYDLGTRNTSVSFQQLIPTELGILQLVFDELCFHGEKIPYIQLTAALIEKMRFWNEWLRLTTLDESAPTSQEDEAIRIPRWHFWHIGGDDATRTFQPNKGSTSARDIEQYSIKIIQGNPARYAELDPIRMRGCPRPAGSIEQRVSQTMDSLSQDLLVVSAICPWHCRMFLHMDRDRDNEMEPKPKHKYIHTFDALSYPKYYQHLLMPEGFGQPDGTPAVEVS